MADQASPARRPSAQKKRAPAGQWPSPDKSMGTAPATHTIESIVVETDKVAAFPRSKKAGRKSEEGLLWSFDFQLLSDGEVHRRTTIMSKWTVQPNERAGGAWREGAVAKIKKWIEVAENVERAAAEEAAAQSDAEMEGVVPAVVRTSTLDHSQVMGGGPLWWWRRRRTAPRWILSTTTRRAVARTSVTRWAPWRRSSGYGNTSVSRALLFTSYFRFEFIFRRHPQKSSRKE